MDKQQVKQSAIGNWKSISPEIRPSAFKNPDGTLKPFYLKRNFTFHNDDTFELEIVNYADPLGKVPLMQMSIKGHVEWKEEHPIADGAYKVDFTADQAYEVMPLHPGVVETFSKLAGQGFTWTLNVSQDIFKKAFLPFGLKVGEMFKEYDLIYVLNDMMFWGARNIDGRGFDTEQNRPTNLQIPMSRVG